MNTPTQTPAYVFKTGAFENRIKEVISALEGRIPVSYAIKSNPFLLHDLPSNIHMLEVCSPGELEICKALHIPPEKIIYSGVVKEEKDLLEALQYQVHIITLESPRHLFHLERAMASLKGPKRVQRVILRLTSGNQFGMEGDVIANLIKNKDKYPFMKIIGIHYYSGTQKKKIRLIERDLTRLEELLDRLKKECMFEPALVEYGPGMPSACFEEAREDACEQRDMEVLMETAPALLAFAEKYPLAIELGRFLATPCGKFYTSVKDIKTNDGVNYALVDGGIHHLKYYGQTMAMQVPPIQVLTTEGDLKKKDEMKSYCICGSLCTTADVLVREVDLPSLSFDDMIVFGRCGAYCMTEASMFFLSRKAPSVWIDSGDSMRQVRAEFDTYTMNF